MPLSAGMSDVLMLLSDRGIPPWSLPLSARYTKRRKATSAAKRAVTRVKPAKTKGMAQIMIQSIDRNPPTRPNRSIASAPS